MTKQDALFLFDAARDNLAEARRYVASDPAATAKLVQSAAQAVATLAPGPTGERLVVNLTVALRSTLADPAVFHGYLDGVRHELLTLRDMLEKS